MMITPRTMKLLKLWYMLQLILQPRLGEITKSFVQNGMIPEVIIIIMILGLSQRQMQICFPVIDTKYKQKTCCRSTSSVSRSNQFRHKNIYVTIPTPLKFIACNSRKKTKKKRSVACFEVHRVSSRLQPNKTDRKIKVIKPT